MTVDEVGRLTALAERCEQATGPDRELDAIIWLHLPEQEGHAWKHGGDKFAHAKQITGGGFVPKFTASLDVAMTLWPGEVPHLIPSDPRICAAMALRARSATTQGREM